jgi:hypothetical protein
VQEEDCTAKAIHAQTATARAVNLGGRDGARRAASSWSTIAVRTA